MNNLLPVLILNEVIILPNQEIKIDLNNEFSKKVIWASAKNELNKVLVIAPINTLESSPSIEDLPRVGVVAKVKSKVELPNNKLRVIIKGEERVSINKYYQNKNTNVLKCSFNVIELPSFSKANETAIQRKLIELTKNYILLNKNVSNSILKTLAITDTENSITGAESLNTDFSGMLNGKVTNTGTKLELTTSISNNAGIDGARFNAFNSLYNNLTKAEQQEMQRLYALNSGSLNNAVNELSQSESMHLELARDAIQNHDVRQAVSRQQHLDRDEGLWAITGKNWGETDGGITRHSYKLTLGKDFYNTDNTYAGALFAYSDNSIGGNSADGEYKNYSLGIYGGSKNSPGTVTGYVSYGVQDNELTRHLGSAFSNSGMGSKLESDYDSSVIGVGAKYAYDLHYGKDGWHVSPYAALDYAHYKQDSFTERGSVFGVHIGGFSDNYLTGELGFDFNRTDDNGKYGFSLAYKRILDGDTLDADFAFAKGGNGFVVQSIDGSKNHVVATAYISTKLSDKWEIGGTLLHDWSSTDRDLSAAVNLNYYF